MTPKTFAINAENTTITYVKVSDSEFFDVEILQSADGQILLPTKQIADILEIPLKINHETKDLFFDGNFKVGKTYVYQGSEKLSENKNKYIAKGLMSDVKDEIFCDEFVLSKVFNTKISVDKSDLSIKIETDKVFSRTIENENNSKNKKEKHKNCKLQKPKKKGNFSLETIQINNSTFSDSSTQIYRAIKQKNSMFNNSGVLTLKGSAFGGNWETNLQGNNYKDELFSFAGLNFKYDKQYNGFTYEFGKISGFMDKNTQVGKGVLGIQVFDYNPKEKRIRDIEGEVNKTSSVNVYVNDEFAKNIKTYDGYYSLVDFYCNKKDILKLELKELKEDGSEKSILIKKFPKYQHKGFNLSEKERQRSAFVGISGFDDRLFAQNGYFYKTSSKKLAFGVRDKYAIKENLISTTEILYDKILFRNNNSIWGKNIYNNNSILSMGIYKNPNTLEGLTFSNSLEWLKSDYWTLKSDVKLSYSKDVTTEEDNLLGYAFDINSIYEKGLFRCIVGLYNQSPDFYLSGSQYGFISDRLGAKIDIGYTYKNWGMNILYNKYFSNTLERERGGIIDFDEINFNLRGRIKNIAQIKYSVNGRNGRNDIGEIKHFYQDINISKYFRNGISLEAGQQRSEFSNGIFEDSMSLNNFNSTYSTSYLRTGYSLPKNKGKIDLEHNITEYSTTRFNNKYNMVRVNYTFPEIKRVLLSLGLGYKYTGLNKGFNYNATIGYRTKSGMILSLMYRYDTDSGYMFDNIYLPSSQRHSINFTINDTFVRTDSGIKSIGQIDDTKGFLEVCAYLDKNNNGEFDKEDIGVENVPIKISQVNNSIYTNRRGKIVSPSLEKGVYKITVDEDNLPTNLSVSKDNKFGHLVLIQPKQYSKISFKIENSVGNIRGNLKVIDDFGRIKTIKDFIVVLNRKDNGQEISYSTIDEQGNYYFSGIPSGEYVITLDENFVRKYNLQPYEDKGSLNAEIPYVYKDFVNLSDMNLVYKSW